MKKNKVLDRVLNIITIIIAVIIIFVAISTIVSSTVGYNSMFGVASMNVLTDSMEGDAKDSINKGDMIYVDILDKEEKAALKVGDIITFWDNIEGKRALNTHRIVTIEAMDGKNYFFTKGDNNPGQDTNGIEESAIIGKYTGNKIAGLGNVIEFFQSATGFMIFVVVPAFLVVVYAIVRVVLNFRKVNKEKIELAVEGAKELTDEEKEALRNQYLESLKADAISGQPYVDELDTDNKSDENKA